LIDPGKPVQNASSSRSTPGFVLSVSARNGSDLSSKPACSSRSGEKEYESERPHRSLNGKTPKEFAETFGIGGPNISPPLRFQENDQSKIGTQSAQLKRGSTTAYQGDGLKKGRGRLIGALDRDRKLAR
jgi:hypothetical protein